MIVTRLLWNGLKGQHRLPILSEIETMTQPAGFYAK